MTGLPQPPQQLGQAIAGIQDAVDIVPNLVDQLIVQLSGMVNGAANNIRSGLLNARSTLRQITRPPGT